MYDIDRGRWHVRRPRGWSPPRDDWWSGRAVGLLVALALLAGLVIGWATGPLAIVPR